MKKEQRDAVGTLEAICLKALERDPEKRYRTALDLIIDLNEWLDATRALD